MTFQLPDDCLNEILECLEEDKITLRSCLLVNRLWCKLTVKILWRNIWSFKYVFPYQQFEQHRLKIESSILSTLISCLPNESKEILHKNEIPISTPTSNSPIFNYASFCKILPICEIVEVIESVLKSKTNENETSITSNGKIRLVAEEIIKMFTNQIYSLKKLSIPNNTFTCIPETTDNFKNLSELRCCSDLHSNLSQSCHNLRTLTIDLRRVVSNELKELISSQNKLKNLNLVAYDGNDWTNLIPVLTKKRFNTLTTLHLYSDNDLSLSFVSSFINLQEFKYSFIHGNFLNNFWVLQHVSLPKLQILKMIPFQSPRPEYVVKFLENNGKNLKEFHIAEIDNALNLSIPKFCPKLEKLFTVFDQDELYILKNIFKTCQNLESIKIWSGERYLSEKQVLETVATCSPKNFYELKIYNDSDSEVTPEDLESFFTTWKNRTPLKSLNLIIIKDYNFNSLEVNKENMKIIEKYTDLGIIEKFETIMFCDDEEEEAEEDEF
ncbi:hypothetical protein C1645_256011 [Glomus cerebriforme]|uniref:F-box domain-containing protein n=1 Tax=Glomus cerebriforme TaxID=658196 RepID=A0A397SPW2_9GLOM|nr:hypothetical protein C1645_256011 [Glomus cerebriforme]